jgi:EmrB/QacA subfamily drug resistance transporter
VSAARPGAAPTDEASPGAPPPSAPPGGRGATAAPAAMSAREVRVTMGVLMTGMLLAALLQTSLSTALPTIAGELGGIAQLPWLVTAYLLTMAASTPLFGKASDLYGRKPLLLGAVGVFVTGSLVAGAAGDIWVLVAARALQGVGAGGLMSLPLAIVGDLVPPRQRGRYQGYFGAVFGVASIVGPALAGFFVDALSWRWIFYVNVPLGVLTFLVVARVLRLPVRRREHRLDYLGAALLVASVTVLLLVLVWGGRQYAWHSPVLLGMAGAGLVLVAAFVACEARAAEPILPLRLLRNRVFAVGNAVGFLVGVAMFGTIVYLPVYLQVVQGLSPTASGMMLLTLMGGYLGTMVGSGRLITRRGRYKVFPVTGTALLALGMGLLSRVGEDTSLVAVGVAAAVVGSGLGCVTQVLVLAIQNAVDPRDLGIATSSASFFRTMGGTLGTALFGAVLTGRLHALLPRLLPHDADVDATRVTGSPATILALPDAVREAVVEAFTRAVHGVFLAALPVALLALVLALRLRELPLRDTHEPAEAAADPVGD